MGYCRAALGRSSRRLRECTRTISYSVVVEIEGHLRDLKMRTSYQPVVKVPDRADEPEQLFRMSGGHPFYEALAKILNAQAFDPVRRGAVRAFLQVRRARRGAGRGRGRHAAARPESPVSARKAWPRHGPTACSPSAIPALPSAARAPPPKATHRPLVYNHPRSPKPTHRTRAHAWSSPNARSYSAGSSLGQVISIPCGERRLARHHGDRKWVGAHPADHVAGASTPPIRRLATAHVPLRLRRA
jgi:hypothetical protein